MAQNVFTLRWFFASIAVPIVIGIASALATHWLGLRRSRYELRMTERRKAYELLLPALADVLAYDRRQLRLAYHDFDGSNSEERAHSTDEEWSERHAAAMAVIREVVARRELAASPAVLKALDTLMAEYSSVDPSTHSWFEACETFVAATIAAVDAVRKELPREV